MIVAWGSRFWTASSRSRGILEEEEGDVLRFLGLGHVVRGLEDVGRGLGEVHRDRVGLLALGELEEARPAGLGDDDVRAALLETGVAVGPLVGFEGEVENAHGNGGL